MIFTMYEQPKILPHGMAEEADLIDDLPEVLEWEGPFDPPPIEPDGFMGITAYWEILDRHENAIAYVFCREAAVDMVRALNARHDRITTDANPIVVKFVRD